MKQLLKMMICVFLIGFYSTVFAGGGVEKYNYEGIFLYTSDKIILGKTDEYGIFREGSLDRIKSNDSNKIGYIFMNSKYGRITVIKVAEPMMIMEDISGGNSQIKELLLEGEYGLRIKFSYQSKGIYDLVKKFDDNQIIPFMELEYENISPLKQMNEELLFLSQTTFKEVDEYGGKITGNFFIPGIYAKKPGTLQINYIYDKNTIKPLSFYDEIDDAKKRDIYNKYCFVGGGDTSCSKYNELRESVASRLSIISKKWNIGFSTPLGKKKSYLLRMITLEERIDKIYASKMYDKLSEDKKFTIEMLYNFVIEKKIILNYYSHK